MNRLRQAWWVMSGLCLLSSLAPCIAGAAITITANAVGGNGGSYRDMGGEALTDEAFLRFGVLDASAYDLLSASELDDFDAVDGLFTELGTVVAAPGGTFFLGGVEVDLPVAPGAEQRPGAATGDRLTVWVFDQGIPVSGFQGQWGLFTSSHALWQVPSDLGTAVLSAASVDSVLRGTDLGGQDFALDAVGVSAVPEPSSLMIVTICLVLAVGRRWQTKRCGHR